MVRPVYSTSSIRMMSLPVTGNGMSVAFTTGWCETVERSSRYRLMSRIPTGTLRCSSASIFWARRCASGTPRRRIPMKASLSRFSVLSRISCASRTIVRSISEALINWDFSRVAGMQVDATDQDTSISLHPSANTFSKLLDVLGLLYRLQGHDVPVVLFKVRLQLFAELQQFRGFFEIFLVVRLQDLFSLGFSVGEFYTLVARTGGRGPWLGGQDLGESRADHKQDQAEELHHLQ